MVLLAIDFTFFGKLDFWLSIGVSAAGLIYSIRAFKEAKEAKTAAKEAGKTVKIQTITIELSEIIQKLDKLDINIDFHTARDILNEINRKVRRLITPFQKEDDYKEEINNIILILDNSKKNLDQVRPINEELKAVPNAVYYAIESDFSSLSGSLSQLVGLFEKRTIEI